MDIISFLTESRESQGDGHVDEAVAHREVSSRVVPGNVATED